jgi:hypothetical protein
MFLDSEITFSIFSPEVGAIYNVSYNDWSVTQGEEMIIAPLDNIVKMNLQTESGKVLLV